MLIAKGSIDLHQIDDGASGKDAYSFALSKESATVSYNADGNAISGELGLTGKARTEVSVLRGNTHLTLASTFRIGEFKILSATVISGTASVSVQNNVIYTNSLTSDTAVIRISINAEGVDMYRDFSLQKLSIKAQVDATKTAFSSEFQKLNDRISLSVSETKTYANNAVAGVQVGGVNIIKKSADFSLFTLEKDISIVKIDDYFKISRTIDSDQSLGMYLDVNISQNAQYTLSFKVRACESGHFSIGSFFADKSHWYGLSKGYTSLVANKTISKTFVADSNKIRLYLSIPASSGAKSFEIKDIKLEEGNIVTPWTAAPEDVSADAQAYADKVAKKAADAAATAQAKADSASLDASNANSRLADWASDSYISPTEKVAMRQVQAQVTNDRLALCEQAGQYNVNSNVFVSVYNDYNTQLINHTATIPENIQISALLSSTQLAYSNARIALTKAIAVAAKTDAQAKADNAKSDAIAQAQADALKNYTAKTEFKSSIDQLAGQIRSKVSQTEYNALGERVKKAETEILQTPEAINLAVRKIEVGGNNLIINSDNIYNIAQKAVENNAFTFNQPDDDGGNKATLVTFVKDGLFRIGIASKESILKLKENTTYTYSIWVKPKVGTQIKLGISAMTGDVITLPSGWSRVKFTTSFNAANKWTIEQGWFFVDIGGINAGDSFYFYHPQLEEGNVATAWQISETEKVNKDNIISKINLSEEGILLDGKKVEITGELLAQIIKAKGLNVGDKTFIDSLGNFKTVNGTFSGKMDATSGSIGNFTIVNGDIIGVDTAKKERIRISTNPLPTLADLFTGYNIISPELNIEFEDYFEIDSQDNSERTQVVCSFRRTIHLEERTTIQLVGQGATFSHRLQGGGTDRFGGATRNEDINFYNSSNQLVATGDWNKPIDIPAGDIIIEITSRFVAISPYNWDDPSIYRLMISTGWQGIIAQGTTEKTYIGADGFYSVFGSGEYIYFKRGVGFVTKGKTDTGGVLASGSVAANGTQTNIWGARATNGFVTKGGVGIFNVPHKIGHTKYTVTASSYNNGITVSIVSKSAYSVQLLVGANGAAYDIGFDYTIIGQN